MPRTCNGPTAFESPHLVSTESQLKINLQTAAVNNQNVNLHKSTSTCCSTNQTGNQSAQLYAEAVQVTVILQQQTIYEHKVVQFRFRGQQQLLAASDLGLTSVRTKSTCLDAFSAGVSAKNCPKKNLFRYIRRRKQTTCVKVFYKRFRSQSYHICRPR